MGSGRRLHYAYKKYGIENFTKEILMFFEKRSDASNYESEIVTEELVKDEKCYNCMVGGETFKTSGMVDVYDVNEGVTKWISQEIYHSKQNRYISCLKRKITVFNKENRKNEQISVEEFYRNREKYKTHSEGKVSVKNKRGEYFVVSKNDERYLSGELIPIWKGKHHTEETKKKQRETFKAIKHQQGIKNSQFGTCWIKKDGISKKIMKEELENYIKKGWERGRKCTH